jgi:hypothetical protein
VFIMLIAIRLLEGMFLLGAVGCVFVLIFTTIDDIRELLQREDSERPS